MTASTALLTERTTRVLGAWETARAVIDAHNLPVARVECGPGTPHALADGGHRWLGVPCIVVLTDPAGLLGWCEVLDVDQLVLHRDARDASRPPITAATGAILHRDHAWKVTASIPRSATGRIGDDLPGGQLAWRSVRAYAIPARLATALRARGLA